MTELSGAWSREQLTSFLESTRVPLRLACTTPSGRLWLVALWYRYRDGALECATGADADVVRYLRGDPAVAFEVSTNDPPYRGVRGNGTAHVAPDPDKALLEALLERYLDGTESALATKLLDPDRDEVVLRLDPDRLFSWDFTERMRDVA